MKDEFHGEGGSFEIDKSTGKRKRVGEVFKPQHEDGDRARDHEGKAIDELERKPGPALPAPAKQAPWAQPESTPPGQKNPSRGLKEAG